MLFKHILKYGLSLLMIISFITLSVHALPAQGEITVRLEDIGSNQEGVAFSLYQLAVYDDAYLVTEDFKEAEIPFNEESTAAEQADLANRLVTYISEKQLEPQSKAVTDKQGNAIFEQLTPGVYLLRADSQNTYGTIQPFIVEIPLHTVDGLDYSIEAYPKASAYPSEPEESELPEGVQTSDDMTTMWWVCGLLISGAGGLYLSYKQSKNKKEAIKE